MSNVGIKCQYSWISLNQGTVVSLQDEIEDMKYLDNVLSEILRFGTATESYRICTKPWRIPDTDIIIPKGMRVQISNIGIHMSEEYYENPETFNPDRFAERSRIKLASEGIYLPFGLGPRQCMGINVAKMEMKMLYVCLLKNFKVEPSVTTKVPLKIAGDGMIKIEGGCHLKFTSLE